MICITSVIKTWHETANSLRYRLIVELLMVKRLSADYITGTIRLRLCEGVDSSMTNMIICRATTYYHIVRPKTETMDIQSLLPLTEPTFFILVVLGPRPRHGYAIMKETASLSKGRVQLSTSTLYGALKRLLDQGWIERAPAESGMAGGRERKAYQLTDLGRRILTAETARLQSVIKVANETAGNVPPMAIDP
jgi:DNA-binding PadR family transcriptional regulator